MGRLIQFETLRATYEEQLRDRALNYFPWDEMDNIKKTQVFPIVRYWSRVKQNIVLEAVYRLVYDAYVWGMRSAKAARAIRMREFADESWERIYAKHFTEEGYELVKSCMAQFAVEHWLDERALTEIYLLGEGLVIHWFCQGVEAECKRSRHR
ncbi:hypothetical protein MK805_13695 [Shimazuella sp. AN120528]|uniref:hypothetical protein n=1 Tax=Shimazuella soli TaxID=1892854 RepID=UPI001F0E4D6F|nr:hypothetical protein [Shimazuella soli]MCH5585995.1 hypothetical protein [Shimazuella soli]